MAAKKTQPAKGKTAAQKKRQSAPPAPPRTGRISEVLGVVLMAMGIFAGYLMWTEPQAGNATLALLRTWICGAAGMLGHVVPLMLLGMGIIVMFVGRRRVKAHRALLTLVGALALCGVWHVFSAERIAAAMQTDGYAGFILASWQEGIQTCAGAGVLGALGSWHLYGYLGTWGAAIALIGIMVVIALCMSRTSVREMGERISGCISGGMDDYRERRQVRGREKAELRAQALARRVAREEQERTHRENAERSIEQERARRESAEQRADELQRRRRKLRQDEPQPESDDDEQEDARPARQRVNARAAHAADVQPVAEDDLESAKARSRGDQEAYNQAMRERMAQEGVPMFLDKRVPGKAITAAGAAPVRNAGQQEGSADAPRMTFSGYDDPVETRQVEANAYGDANFQLTPMPDMEHSVLELEGMDDQPDTSRVDKLLRGAGRPAPSEADVVMRPLRQERDYELDSPPAAPEARHAAHGSASVRRIADARQRYEEAMAQDGKETVEPLDERPDYDVEYAPDDAPYARRRAGAGCAAAPVFINARPVGEPLTEDALLGRRADRGTMEPAPDSAYAAGIAYDNGMPFEQYGVPAAVETDGPLTGADELTEMEPLDEAEDTVAAEPAAAPQPEQACALTDGEPGELPATEDAGYAGDNIAFDGYSGEGGVNEEIALQHTPEIVPETAARMAMYTPVQADLDRQYGDGPRLDGSPIRMPKPAMEEIPQDKPYFYPPIDMLNFSQPAGVSLREQQQLDEEKALKLEQTLQSFGIQAKVVGVSRGPAITRFEMTPAPGVRVSKISGLADDIALNLAATTVRIEAPIPGKSAVGIELPNDQREMVTLRDVLDSPEAAKAQSKLAIALGKDNAGKLVIADIAKMPHVLIAGATGSGKSVCINTIIMSIIYRATPDEVRLILIDPKVVELSVYNGVPHLLVPVVTDPKKAASALNWAVLEMTERYQRFAERGVRDIRGYNQKLSEGEKPMPQIVVIIDELADLMMVAPGEVEESICRLAQLARAAGIHLVIATQRPSVNVITGVIKANIPSRIAFTVASQVDSRTILDGAGAEKLLGRGDMLFFPQGVSKPQRVQGANVTDDEVTNVIEFIKSQHEAVYNPDILEQMERADQPDAEKDEELKSDCDPLLPKAVEIAVELGQVSISMLQRRMRIGYSRAGRIVDEMTQRGIVGAADGAKPRMLLITREEFKRLYGDMLDD